MFYITFNMLWSFNFFFAWLYILFVFSFIFYYLPIIKYWIGSKKFKKLKKFQYITGADLILIGFTPLALISLLYFNWSSPLIIAWFSHLTFGLFQWKIFFLFLFFFSLIFIFYFNFFYFSSREVYDFIIVSYNFFFWLIFLFSANSIFTVIFFIEILSTLTMFLIITASFNCTYFYNNLNLNNHNYFNKTLPSAFLQSIMSLFWISLLASLNLFLFLILFYFKLSTFDWFLIDFLFFYLTSVSSFKTLFEISLIWFNLFFCIFLKCGLVPFFFWKPLFFKGLPIHVIHFYVMFYYFGIFLFFIIFLLNNLEQLFYTYIFINLILTLTGFLIILFIICESFYFKSFLAMSSILNSLFVFLALNSFSIEMVVLV